MSLLHHEVGFKEIEEIKKMDSILITPAHVHRVYAASMIWNLNETNNLYDEFVICKHRIW